MVLHERSPREHAHGRPDILGVTRAGHLLEIEVKRTVSDFRANADKRHVVNRHLWLHHWPKLFWFLVPPHLAEKVRPELPDFAGLLTTFGPDEGYGIRSVHPAPSNPKAERLSIQECIRLVRLQTNQLMSLHHQIHTSRCEFFDRHFDYTSEYQI